MKHTQRYKAGLSALLAAALLGACGGGGGDDGTPMTPPAEATMVPAGALVSSLAYTQFVLQLSQTSSETSEPLSADNVTTAPSSETDEPLPVG